MVAEWFSVLARLLQLTGLPREELPPATLAFPDGVARVLESAHIETAWRPLEGDELVLAAMAIPGSVYLIADGLLDLGIAGITAEGHNLPGIVEHLHFTLDGDIVIIALDTPTILLQHHEMLLAETSIADSGRELEDARELRSYWRARNASSRERALAVTPPEILTQLVKLSDSKAKIAAARLFKMASGCSIETALRHIEAIHPWWPPECHPNGQYSD
jgi:hypothetical protein